MIQASLDVVSGGKHSIKGGAGADMWAAGDAFFGPPDGPGPAWYKTLLVKIIEQHRLLREGADSCVSWRPAVFTRQNDGGE